MVVSGHYKDSWSEMEGDDDAPEVPPGGDPGDGADGGNNVEDLKERGRES